MALKLLPAKTEVSDGYSLSATYSDVRFSWPDVAFKYRPALPEKVYDFHIKQKQSGKDFLRCIVELLKDQLLEWDVEMDVDDMVLNQTTGIQEKQTRTIVAPITDDSLRRMPPPILDFMVDTVTGYKMKDARADVKN